jgi:hypothetical protein
MSERCGGTTDLSDNIRIVKLRNFNENSNES